MKRSILLSAFLILALALAACAPAPAPAPAEEAAPEATEAPAEEEMAEEEAEAPAEEEAANIVETAMAAEGFTTLVTAIEAAGLVDTLSGEGPFTVFAPTDDAFAALPEGTLDSLLEDPEGQLTDILLYHVVPGEVMAADVVELAGQEVETVGGGMLTITVEGETVMVNDATVVTTDIQASNGVIHVIDSVLIPQMDEEAAAEEGEAEAEATPAAEEEMAEGEAADIVDTAIAAGDFGTLVTAVEAAGLVETLKGEGPFTVFAPTDEAFAALPEGTLDSLLEDPEGQLTDILLYHVVAGEVMAADVVGLDGQEVETVGGGTLTVGVDGETVTLTDSSGNTINVVATDIEASNGVIHVIDGVLIPASE
jgi:uncharacterized surface protein with fasciclin (FAS1) repeats